MQRSTLFRALSLAAGALCATAPAAAEEPMARHWIARIGVHPVSPKTDSHTDLKVDNAAGISVGATYLFTQHWGLELFGAFPSAQDLRNPEADRVGSFKMIPMSATVQYHISDDAERFRVYAGVGVSRASIGNERTKGVLAGTVLELDDSIGLAAALGLDMRLGSKWYVTVDARWMDIDSTMKLNGIGIERLEIDPYLFGLSIGRRLR